MAKDEHNIFRGSYSHAKTQNWHGYQVTESQFYLLQTGKAYIAKVNKNGQESYKVVKGKATDTSGKKAQFNAKYRIAKSIRTYQIPDKYLRQIYGKPHITKGRTVFKGAYEPNGRIANYLKPLGIGEKVRYRNIETRDDGKKVRVLKTKKQIFSAQRTLKTPKWSVDGNRFRMENNGRTAGSWVAQHGVKHGELSGKQWGIHLRIVQYEIEINTVNFVQVMIRYAKRIFEKSFEAQKFYSQGGQKWDSIKESTQDIRNKRGILSTRILDERGALKNSLGIEAAVVGRAFMASIVTNPVTDRDGRKVCYAAIHNEASGSYSFGNNNRVFRRRIPKSPSVQRQFMGHSTYIDSFATKIRNKYFLDAVFLLTGK